ncbi:alpha/beta fold hydrolase [Sneathiella limimaris]|uniref:alpha/beta fold hydrolase n=1 Tax=Sneathiella limimaris TaxID=1964213 RepID=UPI00146C4D80|nr:alpha/beta hydrolase [Sneathiella limimaris]
MTDIREGFADLGDIRLHYAESGQKGEKLIILLHGFPEFWFTWRKQLPVLGEKYHVIAPDMRGYNLSERPKDIADYKINHLISDVVKLAKFHGYDEFYLASHDWGAAVAWSVAIAKPDLVKGLMVFNGPHPYIFANLLQHNDDQIAHSQYMADFRKEGIEERLLANDCQWFWDWTFAEHEKRGLITPEEKAEYLRAWQIPGAVTAMLNYYRASPLTPRKLQAGDKPLSLNPEDFIVKVPTLVVWGEKDHALIPENIDGLEKFVPDLKLVKLPEVSHWVTHEDPERVSSEILTYLAELEARS